TRTSLSGGIDNSEVSSQNSTGTPFNSTESMVRPRHSGKSITKRRRDDKVVLPVKFVLIFLPSTTRVTGSPPQRCDRRPAHGPPANPAHTEASAILLALGIPTDVVTNFTANQTPREGGRSGPPPVPAVLSLAQQLQHRLRRQVSLGQHSRRRLLQDLELRERHHLVRHIDVADTRLGGLQVLDGDTQVGNGVLETVLVSTKLGSLIRYFLDSIVNGGNRIISAR